MICRMFPVYKLNLVRTVELSLALSICFHSCNQNDFHDVLICLAVEVGVSVSRKMFIFTEFIRISNPMVFKSFQFILLLVLSHRHLHAHTQRYKCKIRPPKSTCLHFSVTGFIKTKLLPRTYSCSYKIFKTFELKKKFKKACKFTRTLDNKPLKSAYKNKLLKDLSNKFRLALSKMSTEKSLYITLL